FNNQLFGAKFLPLSTRLALGHRLIRHHGDWARHLIAQTAIGRNAVAATLESPCHCAPLSAPQHEKKTRGYYHEHRIRSARGERRSRGARGGRRLGRGDMASRARRAIL